jgi:hypothetical protein
MVSLSAVVDWRSLVALSFLVDKNGRIPYFDIQYSAFNIDAFVKSLPSCHCERSEAISINPSL